jgi:tripartite-type tricarboxylate transporter receptor subunit TctC
MRFSWSQGLAVLATVLPIQAVNAQAYPVKPVRLIVGFAPGGSTDVVARFVARTLTDKLRQSFLVENRSGASGNIASQLVARSPADGHTLLYVTSTAAVNVSLYSNPPFNLVDDFVAVSPVCGIPSILTIHPSLPAKTVKELIALAKSRPGQISYASAGNGSATHLASELFKALAGIDILHVPYQGSGPAMNDLLGGHVQMQFVFNAAQVLANAKVGRLRALAVTSQQRLSNIPDLPTMQEAGVKGYEAIVWNGILAPVGTPREIVSRLNAETAQTMKELVPTLSEIGAYPLYASPEQFAAFIKSEIGKWAGVVKRSGARVE